MRTEIIGEISINVNDLIFNDDTPGSDLQYGSVCSQWFERSDVENIFIVIDSDDVSISVIYPRLHMDENGLLELGVDKEKETFYTKELHQNCNPGLNGDWYCKCGGLDRLTKEYMNTFKKVNHEYTYTIRKLKQEKKYRFSIHSGYNRIYKNENYINLGDTYYNIKIMGG
jgi:hypothetical protein